MLAHLPAEENAYEKFQTELLSPLPGRGNDTRLRRAPQDHTDSLKALSQWSSTVGG